MEYRALGRSGLRISVLTMGTMTFGGRGGFASVGSTGVDQARRQVDMCLEAGVNLIDTADVYSGGLAEEIVGEVLTGRRDEVLLATKVRMPMFWHQAKTARDRLSPADLTLLVCRT
jgi:aryl-alcohol dehydrogenase-like predicted oxidoreductase